MYGSGLACAQISRIFASTAALRHETVAVDPSPDLVCVFGGVIQGKTDEPRVEVRFGTQHADALLLGTVQLLQPGNDLPDIRTGGKRRAPIVNRTPENNTRIVELINSLDNEPTE
jgi:hypothetical protein